MAELAGAARISVVIRYVVWVGIAAHAGFVPLFAWLGYPGLAGFNVVSVAAWVVAGLANARGRSTLAMWLLVAEVFAHAVFAVTTLGWGCGFQYYLIPLIPFVMFNDRLPGKIAAAVPVVVVATFLALQWLHPTDVLTADVARVLMPANIIIPLLALSLVSYYFRLASTDVERRMEKIALTDALTGLFNRRHMTDRLHEEQARFSRTQRPFCVALADIDHFKRINDTFGHDMGDRILQAAATVFHAALRTQDVVARWGGEEFLFLLPDTDLVRAEEVANRLRLAAEASLSSVAGNGDPVTLTFGVAAFSNEMTIDACLKAADLALYQGKSSGRNRVVSRVPPQAAVGPARGLE